MRTRTHQCLQCGKSFEDYFDNTKFCSRQCYYNYKHDHSLLKEIVCSSCHKIFKQKHSKQRFCSVECRARATETSVECICDYCGTIFLRKPCIVSRNKTNYCSLECAQHARYWSDQDTQILANNYGKLSYQEMTTIFSVPKSVDEIKRRAGYIGLTESKQWTQEEIEILQNNYSIRPIEDVMLLLPQKSLMAIRGKAKNIGIKSYFYLNNQYTEEDEQYLRDHYLKSTNEELGLYLGRGANAISQHLWIMGLYRPTQVQLKGYKNLYAYTRSKIMSWRDKVRREHNYTCQLTGQRSNIVVHHIYGFSCIFNEVINSMNLPIYDDLTQYSSEQLDCFVNEILDLQEYYGQYICITENIHNQFHRIYGCGNNTEEQWNKFVNEYYKN